MKGKKVYFISSRVNLLYKIQQTKYWGNEMGFGSSPFHFCNFLRINTVSRKKQQQQ